MRRAQALVAMAWMLSIGGAWLLGWEARLAPLHAQGARLVIIALVALAAWAAGGLLAARLGLDEPDACDAPVATRLLLGLGALGMLWLALGLAGAWRPWLAWTVLAIGAAAGAVNALRAATLRTPDGGSREALPERVVLPLVLAVIGVLVVAPMAFTPPVSSDELIYHLTLPKWWVQAGGLTPLPGFSHSGFPMLVEMLYGWALLMREPVVAKLVHVLFAACAVALAAGAARREGGRVASACAAALLLTTPVFLLNACWAWVDVATSAFVLAGTLLLLRAADAPGLRPAVAAGVAWGLALGAKYTAIPYFLLAAAIALAWPLPADLPARLGARLRVVAVAGLVALAIMGPWLVRNAAIHGNPVHPFADATLGRGRLADPDLLLQDAGAREGLARLRGPLDYHLLNTRADETTGFIWLLALPFLALVPLPARSRRLALAGGGALLLLSIGWSGTVRAQVPALVLLAVPVGAWLAAWIAAGGARAWLGRALLCGAALASLPILAWHDRALFDPASVALGHEPEDAYLERIDPAHAVLRRVDDLAREESGVHVLALAVERLFWLDAPVVASGPCDLGVLRDWARETGNGPALGRRLRAEGFTHVLFGREAFTRQLRRAPIRAAWTDRDLLVLRELLEDVLLEDFSAGGVELYRVP